MVVFDQGGGKGWGIPTYPAIHPSDDKKHEGEKSEPGREQYRREPLSQHITSAGR